MPLLPTHRDESPSGSTIPHAPSSSSDSTHVSRTPTIQNTEKNGSADTDVENEKRRSGGDGRLDRPSEISEKGYDDKGIVEVEDDGVKRKVRVVLEHKSGREMLKEVAGGEYTVPRW